MHDAGKGDLIESWDMEYPITNEVILLPVMATIATALFCGSVSSGISSCLSSCTRRR